MGETRVLGAVLEALFMEYVFMEYVLLWRR